MARASLIHLLPLPTPLGILRHLQQLVASQTPGLEDFVHTCDPVGTEPGNHSSDDSGGLTPRGAFGPQTIPGALRTPRTPGGPDTPHSATVVSTAGAGRHIPLQCYGNDRFLRRKVSQRHLFMFAVSLIDLLLISYPRLSFGDYRQDQGPHLEYLDPGSHPTSLLPAHHLLGYWI